MVVSILIAFSLDAWWDSWNDRREEASLLRSLASDFEENREQLDLSIQGSETILDELFALERLSSQSSFSQAQLDSVPDLLDGLYRWLTYNPITSTLDAAISTGSIGLIRNDLLRGELVDWPRALDDSAEQEVWLSRMILGYNRPFLNGRVLLPQVKTWFGSWTCLKRSDPPPLPGPLSCWSIPIRPEMVTGRLERLQP